MWLVASGFCFVTFAEHTGPVTGVAFLPSASAVLSSSLDGTVRAWDLVRYRNFRTLTTPSPTQFACLAVDPSGEVLEPWGHARESALLRPLACMYVCERVVRGCGCGRACRVVDRFITHGCFCSSKNLEVIDRRF